MDKPQESLAVAKLLNLQGFFTLLAAALCSAVLVSLGAVYLLSKNLPQQAPEPLAYSPGDLRFAFGSGQQEGDLVKVNAFSDGYALLSSGPIAIQADDYRVLRYTWLPPQPGQEAAFFWRRADDPGNVSRTDITVPGTRFLDLSGVQGWSGKILEIGFLVAGENGEPVSIGTSELIPDGLEIRLQLAWRAWTGFEDWSQQSINFLYGGGPRQALSLPLLVAAWCVVTLLLAWVLQKTGILKSDRRMLLIAGGFFLLSWMLLDLRWAANNVRQVQATLESRWHASEQQRLDDALDGEIHQYVQRLKTSVLDKENARILIIGDADIVDYYLFRAKYHLLPFSAHVARRFTRDLPPGSVDYVIFIGDPANLASVPGFRRAWRNALANIDSDEWGMVFRVKKP